MAERISLSVTNYHLDKGVAKETAIPKVLVCREIMHMSKGRIAELLHVTGRDIEAARMQWLDWLDSYPLPLAGALNAAWEFQRDREADHPSTQYAAKGFRK